MKGNCGECLSRWYCDINPDECDAWPDPVPQTNADHIRSMTDEELAEYLWVETDKTFNYCDVCKHYRLTAPHCAVRSQGRECIKARVDWLKQPYKEDT